VRKETGRRLRVYQFWPKVLNLARENLRSLDGQKPGFCSKARRMFRPVCPRSSLSQLNFIWGRKTSVDSEISIIDFLGVECRKYRERESKKKRISSAHKDMRRRVISWIQFFAALPGDLPLRFAQDYYRCSRQCSRPGQLVGSRPRFLRYAATIRHQLSR
jgi:hypothetical protein